MGIYIHNMDKPKDELEQTEREVNDMKDPKICGDSVNINGVYICRLECLPCSHIEGCAKSKSEALVDALIKSLKGE